MSRANSSCQNQGGDLVLPRNIAEHDAIWKVAEENKLFQSWIGLHEEQQTNTFYTSDGKLPSYTNWGLSQPDRYTAYGDEKCVIFWQIRPKGEWHDVSCTKHYSYICQKPSCTLSSCQNGEICLNGKCSCQSGFTGSRCDVDIDECKESPGICQNGANCTNTNGSYTCTCTAAYTGRNCSINIDDCKTDDGSSKCLNNGACIDGEAKFSCKCQDPYFGSRCQFVDECKEKKNLCGKGTCGKFQNGSAYCICNGTGYNGIFCENNINECLLPSPQCDDTIATCIDTLGSYECTCKAGYTGKNCEATCGGDEDLILLVQVGLIEIFQAKHETYSEQKYIQLTLNINEVPANILD
ncbi:neurogenic locus Notch [Paramuricea clavata]|uniref:Neurogenic locus Notch n=1 Tax=Paramuricea clavata TaxID=317549 RepID=A0A7D9J0V0_PARCT|nr:neurogenic locus Notch [Paramuricea clavata]